MTIRKKIKRANKHYKLANLYDDRHKYNKAYKHYIKALKLYPKYKKAECKKTKHNLKVSREKSRLELLGDQLREEKEEIRAELIELRKDEEKNKDMIDMYKGRLRDIFEVEEIQLYEWMELKTSKFE